MQLLEKERAENEAREAALAASMQDSKKKLLDDLAKEDAKREAAVKDIQKLKDKEKAELMNNLHSGNYYITRNYKAKNCSFFSLAKNPKH